MIKKRMNTDEDNVSFEKVPPRGIVRQLVPAVVMYEYPLKGPIGEAIEYEELSNILRSACEDDIVKITINTSGGLLHTAQEIVAEIKNSDAFVVAAVYGECCSAGTMVALACDGFDIAHNSTWLFHNAQHGSVGKAQDVEDEVLHAKKLFKRVLEQHYTDFLTDEEIADVTRGRQLYLFGDEVAERLEARIAKWEKEAEEQAEQDEEDTSSEEASCSNGLCSKY